MQKFHRGDWVRVAKDLGPMMSHFMADCEAIVTGSYRDLCGHRSDPDDGDPEYELYIKGHGRTAWYHEHQLTLIARKRNAKLKEWEAEAKAEAKQKSDLNWIFRHGPAVIKNPHDASIKALAACFGVKNLWGNFGEGMTYYINAKITLNRAAPFLKARNKAGWLAFCKSLETNKSRARVTRTQPA